MTITLLVDADVLIWRASSASEHKFDWDRDGLIATSADLSEAIARLESDLMDMALKLKATDIIITLSEPDPKKNWRRTVLPSYKMHRKSNKPQVFWQLREHLEHTYRTEMRPTLEGDDVMGILATGSSIKGKRIIVSVDKDMQSIPGFLFNPNKPDRGVVSITPEEADRFHLIQTLTGDPVDGYKGCPRIGPKKAEKILGKLSGKRAWESIVRAYESAGSDRGEALVQARVARILRHGEYHNETGVRLWEPSKE